MDTIDEPGRAARTERFRAVYSAWYPDLLRFVTRRVHPTHAEDVVADVFLVVWRRFDDLPTDPDSGRAWVYGIARQCLLNDRRGDRRRQSLAVRIAGAMPRDGAIDGPDADLLSQRLDLARAWPRLTENDQEVISLTAWDGLSGTEAAAVLGISPVAYRLRLSRARRALRRHLQLVAPQSLPAAALTEGSPS